MTMRKKSAGRICYFWQRHAGNGYIVETARRAVSTVSPCLHAATPQIPAVLARILSPPSRSGYRHKGLAHRVSSPTVREGFRIKFKDSSVAALIFLVVLTGLPAARADSVASKNKQGNRLFQEGKYEEAQKAYVEAQSQAPDKPEI